MDTQQLQVLLGRLTGHLVARTPQHEIEIQNLQQSLSRALLPEDIQQLKGSQFNYESADLFAADLIPADRASVLQSIAESKSASQQEPELRVFLREVPVRSPLMHASVPSWAAGASVDHSLGPFTNKDGRQFWFDFFRIEKLVALYVQGSAYPALLFNVRSRFIFTIPGLPPVPDLLPSYQLPPGSIWINSQLLAPNAPAGLFTGLTIAGGTITIGGHPQLIGGKLTITPATVVSVKLQLQQPAPAAPDPTSPYGIDARNATLQLPQHFNFEFSGQDGGTFDQISTAQWKVYGDQASFTWDGADGTYDNALQRILIPWTCSRPEFNSSDSQSPFFKLQGQAPVSGSAWALPAAAIDILNPTPAAGDGGILVKCGLGLTAAWSGLQGGALSLGQPALMVEPGQITLTDLSAANIFCQQRFNLWKDAVNPFGSALQLQFPPASPFFYVTAGSGSEALMTLVDADVQADRPVTVAGQALAIHSKKSVLILAVFKTLSIIYLFDDNILADSIDLTQTPPVLPQPISLALKNALFKVTPVNGCLLFGRLAADFIKVELGYLFLTFGEYAYLPTLPDPYAANLGPLVNQFRGRRGNLEGLTQFGGPSIWMWLVCQVQWKPGAEGVDVVKVSFHFAPLQGQFLAKAAPAATTFAAVQLPSLCEVLLSPVKEYNTGQEGAAAATAAAPEVQTFAAFINPEQSIPGLPDYQAEWDKGTFCLQDDMFALLDVSTNADLLGISFNIFGTERMAMVQTFGVAPGSTFPLQVQGMDVVSSGSNVRAFTVPEISWEPVLNTAPRVLPGDPPGPPFVGVGVMPNYYPDDGGPTRIYNNSVHLVPLAPLPLSKFIIGEFKNQPLNITSSLFTLPFGMRALATLTKFIYPAEKHPGISFIQPSFANNLKGGLQLEFDAGKLPTDDFPMFNGATVQVNNVLDILGNPTGASTLGQSVTSIFNGEFKLKPDPLTSRGVPMTRIDFSGYGASIFSNWFNPLAQMAQTSQSKFDVWVGRTAHEVIQVKSIIYPWGIRVVRTIILYRASTGYEYRIDTGWKAQSDGKFDFSYYVRYPTGSTKLEGKAPDYEIHPGVVRGLYNVQNIVEVNNTFNTTSIIHTSEYYLDDNNFTHKNTGANMTVPASLQMVTFDADVDIEGLVQGQVNGRAPSKKIMGFVQLAPRGIPLSKEALQKLLAYQPNPIGGPLNRGSPPA